MTDLREAGELSTGAILDGRYRLEERIGEGGMARVFKAEDAALRRTVAIKVLRGHVDEVGSVERALSETTLLASLNHHSLVTLFDAHVSEDDASYLVMEYVEGITLRELIADGPVDPVLMASIAVDVAEGLHIAHSAGVIHRDIKPSNVLLWHSAMPGPHWRAKLADFGIAYLLDSPRMTTPGIAVGTVAYIAPEQARGETPAPPADIYALGIMLIEALTGARPFAEAEGIGTVMARLASPPPVPDTLHPAWQGLLRGMTAMRPDDRPTALEVAVAARRLALNGDGAPSGVADEPTAAATAVDAQAVAAQAIAAPGIAAQGIAAQGIAAPTATHPTAIIGMAAASAADSATVALPAAAGTASTARPPGSEVSRRTGSTRARRARRRRAGIIAAIAMAALLIAILVTAWSLSVAAPPSPDPTTPAVIEPSVEPSVEPSTEPAVVPADDDAPAPVDDGGNDNSGSGNSGPGNSNGGGGGNDNSGPGNNNGNGNGGGGGRGGNGGGNG